MLHTESDQDQVQEQNRDRDREPILESETIDPEEELLIAYLDGELPSENTKELEERLAQEPTLRRKLARFEETWDALELLERKPSDQVFISSTIDRVATETAHRIRVATLRSRPGSKSWALQIFLGSLLSAFLGYMSVNFLFSQNLHNLYNDVPIIEQLDHYFLLEEQKAYHIDELDFLHQLTDAKIFD